MAKWLSYSPSKQEFVGSIPGLSSFSDDTLLNRGPMTIFYDILWRIATSVFQSLKMHCHQYEMFAIACEYVANMFYLRIEITILRLYRVMKNSSLI